MSKSKRVFIFILYTIFLCFCAYCAWYETSVYVRHIASPFTYDSYKKTFLTVDGVHFAADVADTEELRERGLSGRTSLGTNEAMLFVFDTEGYYPFWMKDMEIPIDMVWVDENKRVVYIVQNATPDSYPEAFSPSEKATYVVEFPAGTTARIKMKDGDSVSF